MRTVCTAILLAISLPAGAQSLFTDAEQAKVLTYWNAPGRVKVGAPPEAANGSVWQVRLTAEGSRWFWNYQRAIGSGKLPPTQDAAGTAPRQAQWETWIQAKLAYDRRQAEAAALSLNAALRGPATAAPKSAQAGTAAASAPQSPPTAPGLIPDDLRVLVGNPPAFASVVAPVQTTVTFDDGEAFVYTDNVPMRPRFAYYRFPQGTVSYGTALKNMSDEELGELFKSAGMTPAEQRIAKAVSRLEGGFDSVNTYDTGYVSVGFIQFVTMDTGKESLCEVLAREKTDRPDDYLRDFRQFGIDLNGEGVLTALDPATGAELTGPDAVKRVIEDKRLIAVFQRAGKHSGAFRIAQIQVARAHYWPANDAVTVTVNGNKLTCRVCDVIKSEAGLATLFDRKVNRGSIEPLPAVLAKVMAAHKLTRLEDACRFEREIVRSIKYRTDFLQDSSLGQPKEAVQDNSQDQQPEANFP